MEQLQRDKAEHRDTKTRDTINQRDKKTQKDTKKLHRQIK